MATGRTGVSDKIALGVGVVVVAMVLGLLFWTTFKRYTADAPGFPPGWHCINLGRGGYFCEKPRATGAPEAPRITPG